MPPTELNRLKLQVKSVAKQCQSPCSGPHVYQGLSMHLDWPAKKAIVNLPIRLKGNSKHINFPVIR